MKRARTAAVLGLLIVLAAIPLTVLVAQRQQEIRQQAQEITPPHECGDSPFNPCPTEVPITTPHQCGDSPFNPCPPAPEEPTQPAPPATQPTVTQPTPTTRTTPTIPAACAQFSQYCNSSGSCNWTSLQGTSACAGTIRSYYETCLNSEPPELNIQSVCNPTPTSTPAIIVDPPGTLSLLVGVSGIGSVGDSINPGNASLSNKNPRRINRQITIERAGGRNLTINLTYDSASGKFKGETPLMLDSEDITLKLPGFLKKKVTGVSIGFGTTVEIPVNLVNGDINVDNSLSVLDHNILLACWLKGSSDSGCTGHSGNADLNDDGTVNQFDYNLFLREMSVVRQGD